MEAESRQSRVSLRGAPGGAAKRIQDRPSDRNATRVPAIRVMKRFPAPAERVFQAWIDPGIAGRWCFATATRPMTEVAIDARAGGRFRFAQRHHGALIEYSGQYEQIVPPSRLVFRLLDGACPNHTSRVMVDIAPCRSGCELRLRHEHVPPEYAREIEARWIGILYGLEETLACRDDPDVPEALQGSES